MDLPPPPSVRLMLGLMEPLVDAAEATVRAMVRKRADRRRVRQGSTLRPGVTTPMWNEVITTARPFLQKRGAKVKLARILGVPRQRIHDYFVGRTAFPDAERLLLLLHWLAARMAGKDPG